MYVTTVKVESGAHDMNLPTVNVESVVGGGDVCDPHDMPSFEVESAVGDMCSPCKCTCTGDDLRRVATRFGENMACTNVGGVAKCLAKPALCQTCPHWCGVSPEKIDVLEVYAGSARWTRACEVAMLRAGPNHGVNIRGGDQWDLTREGVRRLLWAVIVVCVPKWVHSVFPCTFWHFSHAPIESRSFARMLILTQVF